MCCQPWHSLQCCAFIYIWDTFHCHLQQMRLCSPNMLFFFTLWWIIQQKTRHQACSDPQIRPSDPHRPQEPPCVDRYCLHFYQTNHILWWDVHNNFNFQILTLCCCYGSWRRCSIIGPWRLLSDREYMEGDDGDNKLYVSCYYGSDHWVRDDSCVWLRNCFLSFFCVFSKLTEWPRERGNVIDDVMRCLGQGG